MIINDLSNLETVLENETVHGGQLVVATAGADALSRGRNFAGVATFTFTETFSGRFKSAVASSRAESAAS